MLPLHHISKFGGPPQIQTAFSRLKRADFIIKVCNPYRNTLTNLVVGFEPTFSRSTSGTATYRSMYFYMVRPRGIEPLSTVLQTVAMTTSAKDANDTLLITLYAECHGDIEFVSLTPPSFVSILPV